MQIRLAASLRHLGLVQALVMHQFVVLMDQVQLRASETERRDNCVPPEAMADGPSTSGSHRKVIAPVVLPPLDRGAKGPQPLPEASRRDFKCTSMEIERLKADIAACIATFCGDDHSVREPKYPAGISEQMLQDMLRVVALAGDDVLKVRHAVAHVFNACVGQS